MKIKYCKYKEMFYIISYRENFKGTNSLSLYFGFNVHIKIGSICRWVAKKQILVTSFKCLKFPNSAGCLYY